MDVPLTLDELRTALGDLTAAFLHHRPLTDRQWDDAITTLLTAREQHGGRIRHLIHTIVDAGRPDRPHDALPDALTELHCHLAVADTPPAPRPRPPTPAEHNLRRRRRTARPRGDAHSQLSLFSTSDPDPAPSPEVRGDRVATDSQPGGPRPGRTVGGSM
jgi:hypothetical protein